MVAATSDYILFSLLLPSWTIYIIFLITICKYRDKSPFKSPFFHLLFVLGLIDMGRNVEDWLVFKFASFGWMNIHHLVMLAPELLAKCHSIWAWYLGHAQIFGILCLAFNRLSVIGFRRDWTERQEKLWMGTLLLLPVLTNAPLWPLEFTFTSQNGTDGALLFWKNTQWQHIYLASCGVMCCSAAFVCFIIYAFLFYTARKHNQKLMYVRKNATGGRKESKLDTRLMIVGSSLVVLCAFCGFSCTAMAYGVSAHKLALALPYFNLVNDMLCWVNPYMVLACSQPARKRFISVLLCRDINVVSPGAN